MKVFHGRSVCNFPKDGQQQAEWLSMWNSEFSRKFFMPEAGQYQQGLKHRETKFMFSFFGMLVGFDVNVISNRLILLTALKPF